MARIKAARCPSCGRAAKRVYVKDGPRWRTLDWWFCHRCSQIFRYRVEAHPIVFE